MRYSISDTAEWGDYTAGPQIVNAETRKIMKGILAKIQNGEFAEKWIAENKAGLPNFMKMRREEQHQLIEEVGKRLRAAMPFLNPVEVVTEPAEAVVSAKP
jgi:ketol-acid reductoisomerase